MIIGELNQRDIYARVMVNITCNASMNEIRRINDAYFKKDMCVRILHSVPYQGIYRGNNRDHYLKSNWHELRNHVAFTMNLQA